MRLILNYIRLVFSFLLLLALAWSSFYHSTVIYLIRQGIGQSKVLFNQQSFEEYSSNKTLSPNESANLQLIAKIKSFSVDSLGYKPTKNFTSIYDQNNEPILWVITASPKDELSAYEWEFPIIGKVSYKGFFDKTIAHSEMAHLAANGYDVGIRTVSAWSTLGWLNDPLLSSHLNKKKGSFCNLLFHELFHATLFKANDLNNNENLANFIAHKATQLFLKNDTASLQEYMRNYRDHELLNKFLYNETQLYQSNLKATRAHTNASVLKQKALLELVKKLKNSGISNKRLIERTASEILTEQNAFFIDYMQYNSKQDSLENAFNKFYKGSIKNMVRSLTE